MSHREHGRGSYRRQDWGGEVLAHPGPLLDLQGLGCASEIEGVNIWILGLVKLRSMITIFHPVLFAGENVDYFIFTKYILTLYIT